MLIPPGALHPFPRQTDRACGCARSAARGVPRRGRGDAGRRAPRRCATWARSRRRRRRGRAGRRDRALRRRHGPVRAARRWSRPDADEARRRRAGRGPGRVRRPGPRVRRRARGAPTRTASSRRHSEIEYVAAFCGFAPGLRLPVRAAGRARRTPAGVAAHRGCRPGSVGARRHLVRRLPDGVAGRLAAARPHRRRRCGTRRATEPALLAPGTRVGVRRRDDACTVLADRAAGDRPGPRPVRARPPRRPARGRARRPGRRARQPAGRQRRRTPPCSRCCSAGSVLRDRRRLLGRRDRRRPAPRPAPSGCPPVPTLRVGHPGDRAALLRRGRRRHRGRAGARLALDRHARRGSARRGSRPATGCRWGGRPGQPPRVRRAPATAARAAADRAGAARRLVRRRRAGRAVRIAVRRRRPTRTGSGCVSTARRCRGAGTASSPARGWCSAPCRCRRAAGRWCSWPTTRRPAATR